ncbi:restriction endonuclease subunit S [Vibrio sp. CK2-1]|uniref:restriction endonuclease subunit S n=1 Tax=Vibrio sp. CK2-1 TaxID=2912249 RepID=UPI001F0225D1|nr:restriction endonuclease subunit S [Vibrio sp. CK2-1]MCF7355420.1 restriction endonuclease subunit S [Vibrio sp. CK2-1]
MSSEQCITEGYKKTEVGVIPEDWVDFSFGDICTVNQGLQIPIEQRKSHPGQRSKIYITIQYLSSMERPEYIDDYSVSVCCNRSDILMTRTGNTGIVVHDVDGVFHNNFFKINFDRKKFNKLFLVYYLRSFNCQKSILDKAGTSTIPDLNHGDFYSVRIVLPQDIKEQTAIANALSDVDALLSELEKLIAKKQDIKTAAMQQLLTGKTRLSQFATYTDGDKQGQVKGSKTSELGEIPEDWDVYVINDVIESLSSGGTPFRGNKSFYKGTNLWITSGELKYGRITDTIEKINNEAIKASHLKVHPEGTFLMAITGLEAAGTRGSCGIVGKPATTNQSCMAIYPNKQLTSEFLFHWYVYNGNELALKYCQGTKQLSYTAGLLKTLPILLPKNPEEQAAIATILSDMDEEIQALQQRLSKTRQIKQGMMQELLTGKTRLPFDKVDADSKGEINAN